MSSGSMFSRLSDWVDARQRGTRRGVGVYLQGERSCRVMLRRQGGVLGVASVETVGARDAVSFAPALDAASGGGAASGGTSRFASRTSFSGGVGGASGGPVGVALADLHGFHRFLTLPPADHATTRQLAAVQLESILPGQQDVLRWGVQRVARHPAKGEPSAALLFATSDAVLAQATAPLASVEAVSLLTAAPAALDALLKHAGDAAALRDRDVVLVEARSIHLLSYREGLLASLETHDRAELADDSAEALAAAIHEGLSRQQGVGAGREVTLIADDGVTAALAGALRTHGRAEPTGASALVRIEGLDADDVAQLLAAGAAVAAMEPASSLNLSPRGGVDEAAVEPVKRGHWLLAAVWLLAACGAWYAVDVRTASVSRAALEGQGLSLDDVRALDTQLAVGRYLEKSGPTFLAILDELTQKTSGFQVDSLRYERQGQLTLRGTDRSGDAVNKIAADMATMRTLASVQVRSLSQSDRERVSYTIVADANPRFTGSFVKPPPPEDKTPPAPAPAPAPENQMPAGHESQASPDSAQSQGSRPGHRMEVARGAE